MTKRLLIFALLLFTAKCASAQMPGSCVPGTNIYYISSGIGSDANTQAQAKNKATPWAHHPYMHNFTGTYSHTVGDCFAFRGGDTWSASSFTMNVTLGGNSTTSDYYGVDLTWFTGGSFTRPLFDMNYVLTSANHVVNTTAAFVVFDNIEIYRQLINLSGSFDNTGYGFKMGFSSDIVENSYMHDWATNGDFTDAHYGGFGDGCMNVGVMDHTTCSDQNGYVFNGGIKRTNTPFGGGCHNCTEVRNGSLFNYTFAGCFTVQSCHDSEFEHIYQSPTGNYCDVTGSGCHGQIIENDNPCGGAAVTPNDTVYNNLIHDNNTGVNIFLKYNNAKVYNNVMWNNVNNYAIRFCSYNGDKATDFGQVYNNTIDMTGGQSTAIGYNTVTPTSPAPLGSMKIQNNHIIGAVNVYSLPMPVTASGNLQQTSGVATGQGYTPASKYQAAGDTVTFVGVNLTALAVGGLTALAKDAEGTPWFGLTAVSRPTGSTKWNPGAYQSPFSGGGTPPTVTVTSPAAGTISGTVTITVTASGGTVSSIQPLLGPVGGPLSTFGNACTSSPCSALWDTTKYGNGSYQVGGTATNGTGQGNATPVTVTVNNSTPGCTTSAATWTNTSFTTQTGAFTATLTGITPNGVPPAGTGGPVFALSQNAMTAFPEGSVLVRQSDNGFWEVYNGTDGLYEHTGAVSWIVGTAMVPVLAVDIVAQKATVQVTQNGVTTTIATGYPFRAAATSLGFWNLSPGTPQTLTACNFTLGATGALTPTSFNFGTLNVGTSATQVFTLTNNGGSPLTVSAYAVSPSVFTIFANGCVSPLAAGANCPITIKFAPTAGSPYSGTLHLTTTGTINDSTITGTGSSISVPGAPTNLTAVALGTTIGLNWTGSLGTPPITYNVSRGTTSGGPYTLIATGVTATNYSDPALANGTYYYVVSGTNTVGTGVNSTQASATISTSPQVNLSPASLSFGNVQLGGSGSLNLTITNMGNANLVFNTPAISPISGANAADFSFGSGCPDGSTVAAGSSCSFLVTFTPSATGVLEQGVLCASSNSPTNPDCVTLNGTGVAAVVVSPTSLSFGNIFISKTSASQTVTFTNNSGATVTFSSIALTTGTQFAIGTNTCGASVANNTACTVAITFTPTSVGNKSDTLTFTDSAAGSPHTVTMSGNGKKHGILKVGAGI